MRWSLHGSLFARTPPVYGEGVTTETTVTVRYFAAAADAAGLDEETLTLQDATVGALRAELASRYGTAMERVLRSGSFLVDRVVSRDDSKPIAGAVDVLPPFAGG